MDAQQELFTTLKLSLEALGYAVYDGFMPPEGTKYPFVYLGDFRQSDDANKTAIFGNVYATIHVWSNTPRNRGTVSEMLNTIRLTCYGLRRTANYSWSMRNADQQIISDNTTNTPLLHGVLEVEFKFS